jgi:hypothetical protein
VNDAGALARSIGLGLMPVTHSGHGRVSLTVSVMLPRAPSSRPRFGCTPAPAPPRRQPVSGPADTRRVGRKRHRQRRAARQSRPRACPTSLPPLMKFATGRPKPLFGEALACDRERRRRTGQIDRVGLMPVTHSGHGRVSLTVSVMLPRAPSSRPPFGCTPAPAPPPPRAPAAAR